MVMHLLYLDRRLTSVSFYNGVHGKVTASDIQSVHRPRPGTTRHVTHWCILHRHNGRPPRLDPAKMPTGRRTPLLVELVVIDVINGRAGHVGLDREICTAISNCLTIIPCQTLSLSATVNEQELRNIRNAVSLLSGPAKDRDIVIKWVFKPVFLYGQNWQDGVK